MESVRTTVGLNYCSDDELRLIFRRLGFVTSSEVTVPVLRQAFKAAIVSDATILLEGETGTGKQVLARAIHELDQKRAAFPFVTAHCSTISETLAESEFFGHHRGAFTGAVVDRGGLFKSAHRGTLLLDDVNDLPLAIQPKLLDVIQRGVLRALGSDRESPVNVRIIATSNQPLKPLVLQNRFRSDLYYRLNVIRLQLPSLRERPGDLADLILALASRHRVLYDPILSIDPALVSFLQSQWFTGNVRELENGVLRMLLMKDHGTSLGMAEWLAQSDERPDEHGDPLGEAAQKLWEAVSQHGLSYTEAIDQMERKFLETALKTSGNTRREIARRLGTSERTLYHKIRAHHLTHRPVL